MPGSVVVSSPTDPDAKIVKMNDGTTHLADKPEHAVDLDTGAVVAVMILGSSWILIRDAVDILLEGTPAHVNIVSLREQLDRVEGVGR